MARMWLGLDLEEIAKLGVAKYMGNPQLGVGGGGVCGRLTDLRPAWNAVRQVFFQAEADLYASGGQTGDHADEGIPWEPNLGDYGGWKAVHFGTPPGVLTGRLRAQLTGQSDDHYERDGPHFFEIGSDAPVGDWSGKREMPYWSTKHVWSSDSNAEDVGGLMAQGGSQYWRIDGTISDQVEPRPPISINEDNVDSFVEAIMDYVTQAPVTRGWFNPGTGQWSGTFRRVTGFTSSGQAVQLIAGGGAYRRSPSGRLRKARVT